MGADLPFLRFVDTSPDEGPAYVVPQIDGPARSHSRRTHESSADKLARRRKAKAVKARAWLRTKQRAFPEKLVSEAYAAVAPPSRAPPPGFPRHLAAYADEETQTRLARLISARALLERKAWPELTALQIMVTPSTLHGVAMGTDVFGELQVVVSLGADQRGFLADYEVIEPAVIDFTSSGAVEFLVDARAATRDDIYIAVYEIQHPDDETMYPVCGPTSFPLPAVSALARASANHIVPLSWWHADVPFHDDLVRKPATISLAITVTPLPFNSRAAARATKLDARIASITATLERKAASASASAAAASPESAAGSQTGSVASDVTDVAIPVVESSAPTASIDVIPPSVSNSVASADADETESDDALLASSSDSESEASSAASRATSATSRDVTDAGDSSVQSSSVLSLAPPPPPPPPPPPRSALAGLRGLDHPLDIAFDLHWSSLSSHAITALHATRDGLVAGDGDGAIFWWQVRSHIIQSTSSSEPTQKKHSFDLVHSYPAIGAEATAVVLSSVAVSPTDVLIVAYDNSQMRVWQACSEPPQHECLQLISLASPVTALASDPHSLVSGARDGSVHLWSTGKVRLIVTLSGATGAAVTAVAVAGTRAVTSAIDGQLSVWSVARSGASLLHKIQAHKRSLTSFALPMGSTLISKPLDTLATASADGMVKVWDMPRRLVSHNYFALKRGPVLAVVFDGSHMLSVGAPPQVVNPSSAPGAPAPPPPAELKLWSLDRVRHLAAWPLPALPARFTTSDKMVVFGLEPHDVVHPPENDDDEPVTTFESRLLVVLTSQR
ncbi:uncharacterized protein AMSG_06856 [Thecamonas trahens ATCC 50062]|uniref:Uncharacterized protein n=1 Tax=Thecamonas trahens ATCC 50062 TaxID=461836 RepID=A0A0L0DDH0_THETB|nr:hypothetical protein AMSG_06856 [Thecamonas trahens ATCC 50062]KNC50369.1 hypothetical protein AMSG_06856 [Thecamonas trahens ATCC 50062]|eukprot:XP_013756911.1 hypothetical protein AMSG_06856 [Thecamonas trahens ATCC 50062]